MCPSRIRERWFFSWRVDGEAFRVGTRIAIPSPGKESSGTRITQKARTWFLLYRKNVGYCEAERKSENVDRVIVHFFLIVWKTALEFCWSHLVISPSNNIDLSYGLRKYFPLFRFLVAQNIGNETEHVACRYGRDRIYASDGSDWKTTRMFSLS